MIGMSPFELAIDYASIFRNSFVLVSGVSRSGTSILAKIIGSFKHVIYLHEPTIMRYMGVLLSHHPQIQKKLGPAFLGTLFEDYFLQRLHGRNLNFKSSDTSFIENFETQDEIQKRWKKYVRRQDVMKDVERRQFMFVVKINEVQPLYSVFAQLFEGIKIIEIIRNGCDVIGSSLSRGWYSNDYLNHSIENWIYPSDINIPWYVPKEDHASFSQWNPETRVAYNWRILIQESLSHQKKNSNYLPLTYEDLILNPEKISSLCERFLNLQPTSLTQQNIKAVKDHSVKHHAFALTQISPQERTRFIELLRQLNYPTS